MKRTIVCMPDNVAEFNAALRSVPEFFALAKALQSQGVLKGLRGSMITFHGDEPAAGEVGGAARTLNIDKGRSA